MAGRARQRRARPDVFRKHEPRRPASRPGAPHVRGTETARAVADLVEATAHGSRPNVPRALDRNESAKMFASPPTRADVARGNGHNVADLSIPAVASAFGSRSLGRGRGDRRSRDQPRRRVRRFQPMRRRQGHGAAWDLATAT